MNNAVSQSVQATGAPANPVISVSVLGDTSRMAVVLMKTIRPEVFTPFKIIEYFDKPDSQNDPSYRSEISEPDTNGIQSILLTYVHV